jgi:nucleotide-binding universal stress UspA family protein
MSPAPSTQTQPGYASIMVPMDSGADAQNRVKLATALADRFSSRLIGVAAHSISVPLYFEASVEGVASAIEIQEKAATREIALAEASFRKIVATRNRTEWRHAHSLPSDFILQQARAADLIVTSRPRPDEDVLAPMAVDAGDLVLNAGRPVLFVPPNIEYLAAKTVLIAWKDTREARRAVADSLPFLKGAEHVVVASIDSNDQAAKDVIEYLGCHSVDASLAVQQPGSGSVADDLLRIADRETADLIVSGAYGHSRAREWMLGGVTRDLLDHARVCCLMAH